MPDILKNCQGNSVLMVKRRTSICKRGFEGEHDCRNVAYPTCDSENYQNNSAALPEQIMVIYDVCCRAPA